MKRFPKRMMLMVVTIVAIGAPLFASGSKESSSTAPAQPAAKTYTMRATTPLAKDSPLGMALDKLCELVTTKSNGQIKTTANYSGQLGTQLQQVQMVHDGSLEVVQSLASGTARYVPQLALFEFPYIYKDVPDLVHVLNTLQPEVAKLLAPYNFVPIGGQTMGFRDMLNKKHPINTPADLNGLKMRGPNPVYVAMFNALGATGVTTDWSEIYGALQSGVIDGMESAPADIYSMKFNEVAPYLSITHHIAGTVYFMFGKKWLDSLPPNLKQIVEESAKEAATYEIKVVQEVQSSALKKMEQQGLKVNNADISAFKSKLAPWKKSYVQQKGPGWVSLYDKIVAAQ